MSAGPVFQPGDTYSYESTTSERTVTWTRDEAGLWHADDDRGVAASDADIARQHEGDAKAREALRARVDAALEARSPSTPLMVMARTINRLAETLAKDHECEGIFSAFDDLGEYVGNLETEVATLREELARLRARMSAGRPGGAR